MGNEIAILDFFDDETYFNAASSFEPKPEMIAMKAHIAKLGIKTAIITWLDPTKFEHWLSDATLIRVVLGINSGRIPAYIIKGKYILVFMCVGAPNAAAVIEEIGWFGIKNFLAYGSAGCLDPDFDQSKMLIPIKAIRDEGTSFHYLPPSLYVETDIDITNAIVKVFIRNGINYEKGITWTTDGIYRETVKRTAKRFSQGAIAVEMECSAFAAAAISCGVKFGQFLFFSDGMTNDGWKWMPSTIEKQEIKEKLFDIAIEIAKEIEVEIN